MLDATNLSTERLLLPPLTRTDTADLAAVYSDPNVARYVGGDRLTEEIIKLQTADFADEWMLRGYGQSAVVLRSSGKFIGRIGLHYWSNWDEIELGYILAKPAQGSGLATEGAQAWLHWADSASDIDHLIANIDPHNAASIGLAMKLGFEFDRNDTTASGRPTSIYRRECLP